MTDAEARLLIEECAAICDRHGAGAHFAGRDIRALRPPAGNADAGGPLRHCWCGHDAEDHVDSVAGAPCDIDGCGCEDFDEVHRIAHVARSGP